MQNFTLLTLFRISFGILLACSLTVPLVADSIWEEALGGDFGDGANWDTVNAPDTTASATFNLDETYTVTFDDDYTNDRALVSDGVVTFDLSDKTYTLINTGSNPASLDVGGGNAGSASLIILSDGVEGALDTVWTRVGFINGGTGNLTVTDTTWNNSNRVLVGGSGATGTLRLDGGSSVAFDNRTDIGSGSGSAGEITVSGPGTSWTNASQLYLGTSAGEGVLNLADGATATVNLLVSVGTSSPNVGSGEVNITGGAKLTTAFQVFVGRDGQVGTINISGEGSEWDGVTNNDWFLGSSRDDNAGIATINITDGGVLSLRNFNAVTGGGSTVSVTVDGTNSELNISSFNLTTSTGAASTSTTQVTISNEGAVNSNAGVNIGQGSAGSATLEVNSGSSLAGTTYTIGGLAGSDGHLVVTGSGSTASTVNITVGNEGTGVMDILNGGVVTTSGTPTIGNQAGSTGTVTISGTNSQWTLSAGNGTVTVGNDGTGSLILADGGTLLGSATIGTTGTLSGDGIIGGLVTNSGLVSPGNSTGILYTLNGYTQTATGTLEMGIGGLTPGTGHDQISNFSTNFDATLAGTLNILSVNSFMPSLDDEFLILDFTAAGGSIFGEFDTINAFSLDSGLAWNFDDLYIDGTISVIPEPATVAFLLGAAALGAVLWRRRRSV